MAGRRALLAAIAAGGLGLPRLIRSANAAGASWRPKVRVVASGLFFPEGPVTMGDGSVVLVEIGAGVLTRISASGEKTIIARLGGGPNGTAIGPDGAAYICNDGGLAFDRSSGRAVYVGVPADYQGGSIQRVDLNTGAWKTLYTEVNGNRLKGPNDIVFDQWGGMWFTDTGKNYARSRDHGGLYWAAPDGSEIREIVYPLLTPNGIGLSHDRRTLYVALSERRQVLAYTLTGPGGALLLEKGKPKQRMAISMGDDLGFDNLAVEESGNIIVAGVRKGLLVFSPAGQLLQTVILPDPIATAPAFGGPTMKTLYVTLSALGQLIAIDWPRRGVTPIYRR